MALNSQPRYATHRDQEKLTEVSMSLHQAAQPLTALQGWIEMALSTAHTDNEYKSLMTHAMQELQRVFESFDNARRLAGSDSGTLHV